MNRIISLPHITNIIDKYLSTTDKISFYSAYPIILKLKHTLHRIDKCDNEKCTHIYNYVTLNEPILLRNDTKMSQEKLKSLKFQRFIEYFNCDLTITDIECYLSITGNICIHGLRREELCAKNVTKLTHHCQHQIRIFNEYLKLIKDMTVSFECEVYKLYNRMLAYKKA
jgi:hypothetical protein